MRAGPAGPPVNPALLRHLQERSKRRENRVADQITRFAGSMKFVYIHAIWFSLWIGLGVEDYPFGLLTMIVSLEAIFLSTFVMISQNRADEKRQVIADEAWRTVQEEEQQNERLLRLSNEILDLTKQIHAASAPATPASVRERDEARESRHGPSSRHSGSRGARRWSAAAGTRSSHLDGRCCSSTPGPVTARRPATGSSSRPASAESNGDPRTRATT